ncbi:MAG TPA: hypothetical protein PKD84_07635 [Propionicimonas sp.]|nr:hypothetical protein [Propionicimonas sp.]
MINPLDRLGPRALLSTLRSPFWAQPVGWAALLVPTPWFLISQMYYVIGSGADALWAFQVAVTAQLAMLATLTVLIWVLLPVIRRVFSDGAARTWQLIFFAVGGSVSAAVVVVGTPSDETLWVRWAWASLAWSLSVLIWVASAAILVDWSRQVRAQRRQLQIEYERQLLTRTEETRALIEADRKLTEVRANTHAAVFDIRGRLHSGMTVEELSETVIVIENVVASKVRPTSHDLAAMPAEPAPLSVDPLWQGWREVLPSLIRSWPLARPFQPMLVVSLSLPIVFTAELAPPPHRFDPGSLWAFGSLAVHLLLLAFAEKVLAPRLRNIEPRSAVAVVFGVYLVTYLVGLTALMLSTGVGWREPLEAFLMPPLLAMVSGWAAAFAMIRNEESAAARNLILRTNWELRRTRQRLWAQRRRLATALHGRVQANLTAAALMLGAARDRMLSGTPVDDDVIMRVRETLSLADLIDQTASHPPAERLATVTSVWEGVLDVSLDLRPGANALLRGSRDLCDACVEVLREILLNAVRHSGAQQADVVVGADDGRLLCLRVHEHHPHRSPLGAIGGPGLGRSLIDSLALDWAEADTAAGRVTVALFASGSGEFSAADARSQLFEVTSLH